MPGPLPLGVAVIDSSVRLYGQIFPRVAHKHRYQMLQHFNECIKQAKSTRQQAVQMNIFTAVLCAMKVWTVSKSCIQMSCRNKHGLKITLFNRTRQDNINIFNRNIFVT